MKRILHPKGRELYVFWYDDPRELLKAIGRTAADPELSFNWYDAAIISQRLRKEMRGQLT